MTATMTGRTFAGADVAAPSAATPGRRSRRLCIDAHTDFVETLVAELQSSVARLQAASRRLVDGAGDRPDSRAVPDVAGLSGLDREAKDIARLVGLLDAIDGPRNQRRLVPLSLPETITEAAAALDVAVEVAGRIGDELFVADAACVRTGVELLLQALAGDGSAGPVLIRIGGDREVVLEGTMDLADPRRSWQLRCGRRVLEGEDVRVRLSHLPGRYHVALEVGR